MTTDLGIYPPTPLNVPAAITNPSAGFKKEVKKVLLSIFLFFAVYIILMILSGALAVGCLYAGFYVMIGSGHIIGILAGLGIMSIGIMVFIFLIKFMFSVKKHDESGTLPVTEQEQPKLFQFIRQLTADTQTQFPKRIVLSPEVNACVYYNDSFWSMIFPVKKNLQIGLALVNSLTLSEFKAVMAHEFGHFSQRSMKLGSFVYNVNKALYNMLYENKDFGNFLSQWGNLHWAIGIFVWVTVQLLKGIQGILQVMYGFINKNYMGLSREMEFHADAVAASVSGSNNLVSALRKTEITEPCYQNVIQKADEWLGENYRFENIYHNHDEVMLKYAMQYKLPLENATPVPDNAFFKHFQINKVNIKNQWASHPSVEERQAHLQSLSVEAVKDSRPAWIIFNDTEMLQKRLTEILYRTVPGHLEKEVMDAAAFKDRYLQDAESLNLPEAYNGFYDNRQMSGINIEAACNQSVNTATSFEELFNPEKTGLTRALAGNEYDATILKAIVDKKIRTKTFDYDGEKMSKNSAPVLLEKIKSMIAEQKQTLQQHEERIFCFFYQAAQKINPDKAEELIKRYRTYFDMQKNADDLITVGQSIMQIMQPLIMGQSVQVEEAKIMAQSLRDESETLKPILQKWLIAGLYYNKNELDKTVAKFIQSDYHYFSNTTFFDNELKALHQTITETASLMGTFQLKTFKAILDWQLTLVQRTI